MLARACASRVSDSLFLGLTGLWAWALLLRAEMVLGRGLMVYDLVV